jgi:Zn ribbon nucleic-acid-binding protein
MRRETEEDDSGQMLVGVACPQCEEANTMAVYRHFDCVSLMCPKCEHAWDTLASSHSALQTLTPLNRRTP